MIAPTQLQPQKALAAPAAVPLLTHGHSRTVTRDGIDVDSPVVSEGLGADKRRIRLRPQSRGPLHGLAELGKLLDLYRLRQLVVRLQADVRENRDGLP